MGDRGKTFAKNGRLDLFSSRGVAAAMAASDPTPEPQARAAHIKMPTGPNQRAAPAGGRSSNARPDGGHTRGNLHGVQQQNNTPPPDFLERVNLAEQRDGLLASNRSSVDGDGSTVYTPCGPLKGRGVCNPLVEYTPNTRAKTQGVQLMPDMGGNYGSVSRKNVGAAGQSSTDAWRCSHNYMAHGAEGYGDMRSEHMALTSTRQDGAAQDGQQPRRHMLTESKVVFGGDAGGLYPHAPSMIRGKHPGY